METTLSWGTGVVLWLQRLSPTLDAPFRVLTFLGTEEFYLPFLALVYWCWNRSSGAKLLLLFLLSFYIGAWLKVLVNQPRPFQYDPRVQQLFVTVGNGFPSIHALAVVTIWGYLTLELELAWSWMVAGALMVLIPLSRLYLGLHFPTDLLGGYLIGIVLLPLYLMLEPRVATWLTSQRPIWHLGMALALSALLLLALPARERIGVNTVGLFMGVSVGFVLESQHVRFSAAGIWETWIPRFLLGIAGLFILRLGLQAAFDGLPETPARFIRYTLMGLWLGFGAPLVFVKLGLM